jgi:hypothetical protein
MFLTMRVASMLKGQDKWAKPQMDEGSASIYGGVISVLTYLGALIFMVQYLSEAQDSELPGSSTIEVFPGSSGQTIKLPKMNCIAPSGCWYVPQASEGYERKCYWIAQGEAIADLHSRFYYSSDPIDTFTVAWTYDADLGAGVNFGVSYEVDEVVGRYDPLDVKTTKAAVSLEMTDPAGKEMPFKIYKGTAMLNLVRTIGLDEKVDSWTSTVTSEDGTPDAQANLCCHPMDVTAAATGDVISDSAYKLGTRCADSNTRRRLTGPDGGPGDGDGGPGDGGGPGDANGGNPGDAAGPGAAPGPNPGGDSTDKVYQVRLSPFPTFSKTTLEQPLTFLNLWTILGGAMATMDLVGSIIITTLAMLGLIGAEEKPKAEGSEGRK